MHSWSRQLTYEKRTARPAELDGSRYGIRMSPWVRTPTRVSSQLPSCCRFANSFTEPTLISSARQPRKSFAALGIVANIRKSSALLDLTSSAEVAATLSNAALRSFIFPSLGTWGTSRFHRDHIHPCQWSFGCHKSSAATRPPLRYVRTPK